MEHELQDVLEDPTNIIVIEWGEVIQPVLPQNRLKITIKKLAEEARELVCEYPESIVYLMEPK